MNFFKKIIDSVYSPAFYSKISQQSLGSAIGYFALFVLLLATIQTGVIFFSQGFLSLQQNIETSVNKAVASYPADVTINIHNGTVSTNVKEPYAVPFPGGANDGRTNILVIDTKTPFSTTDFRKYSTFAWLTKDSIFMAGDSQMRTIDLSQVKEFTLDKKFVTSLAQQLTPWLKVVTPLLTIAMLVGLYIANFCRLVYLFFLALLIMLLTKIMKKSLSYGQAYKVGVYAMTAGFLVELLGLFVQVPHIPFFFTLIALVVVFLNIRTLPQAKKAAATVSSASKRKKKS